MGAHIFVPLSLEVMPAKRDRDPDRDTDEDAVRWGQLARFGYSKLEELCEKGDISQEDMKYVNMNREFLLDRASHVLAKRSQKSKSRYMTTEEKYSPLPTFHGHRQDPRYDAVSIEPHCLLFRNRLHYNECVVDWYRYAWAHINATIDTDMPTLGFISTSSTARRGWTNTSRIRCIILRTISCSLRLL